MGKNNTYSQIHKELGKLLEINELDDVLSSLKQIGNKQVFDKKDIIRDRIESIVYSHYKIKKSLKYYRRLDSHNAIALSVCSFLFYTYLCIGATEIANYFMKSKSYISESITKIKDLNPKIKSDKTIIESLEILKKEIDEYVNSLT